MKRKTRAGRGILYFLVFFMAISLFTGSGFAQKGDKIDFPQPAIITPNVIFWIKIFREYTQSKGLVHDMNNPSVIYEIIELDPAETGAAKNNSVKKKAVEKYRALLRGLSKKKKATSKEEKRIIALFAAKAVLPNYKNASANVRCQVGLKDKFREGLIRSGMYLEEFKRIFKSHGLPEDLVYLPHVESAFQTAAHSSADAAGIWQFIPTTGNLFMVIDKAVDERKDPYIAADAAARLLKRNFESLGEWPLAITAYNHGLAGMKLAKKKWGSYEAVVRSYRGPQFGFASKNFYPEFLAARALAKNAGVFYGDIKYAEPLSYRTVKLKRAESVAALYRKLGVNYQEIRQLNPSLQPAVFKGEVKIPEGFLLKFPQMK